MRRLFSPLFPSVHGMNHNLLYQLYTLFFFFNVPLRQKADLASLNRGVVAGSSSVCFQP